MKLTVSRFCLVLALCLQAAQAAEPGAVVREATEKMLVLIDRNQADYRASSSRFYTMVDKVMLPSFDLQRIGHETLGSHWRSATTSQRKRLAATFKNSLIHSYADAVLAQYEGLEMEWAAASGADSAVVRATLIRPGNRPTALAFSMASSQGQWKIHDVVVDGVSLAAGLRSQFNSEIARNGLEGLLQRLESPR